MVVDSRPIGLFDSGVGGLSVLRELRAMLPAENYIYYADQAHLPYGEKSSEMIRRYALEITQFLLTQDCKALVVPCNSACAAALHYLRDLFPQLPIIGMEPAIKPAAAATRTGAIGVIMTRATFQGELYASVVDRFAQGIRVEARICPDLVTLVEAGAPQDAAAQEIVEANIGDLRAADIDQLVLGCTHFPFLRPHIERALGPHIAIIDPGPAVARQTVRLLNAQNLIATRNTGSTRYITSGNADRFQNLLALLLGESNAAVETITLG